MHSNAVPMSAQDTVPTGVFPLERPLEVRFTGSGSEYFRIWIVNLLLSIVTLSLYRPWAKVRRLRYFYGNTLVDGHALDFHGNPKKMLRGYLLVGAMVLAYSIAGRVSPMAALVAFLILCVLWPALLKAALQFRLANTSWRGLRFRFTGRTAAAYGVLLPLFVPGLVIVAAGLNVADPRHPPQWYGQMLLVVMLCTALVMPLLWLNLKRYQHNHYALGQWQTRLGTTPGSVYMLCLKGFGVMLLSFLLAVGVVFVLSMSGAALGGFARGAAASPNSMRFIIVGMLVGAGTMFIAQLLPLPYFVSRSQNLIWSATDSDAVRFDSRLRFTPLFGLTLKNWLLMVLTLGLYWPFAAVATYRMRVESITPTLLDDLDSLRAQLRPSGQDATGDAAGDLFGIDIGL